MADMMMGKQGMGGEMMDDQDEEQGSSTERCVQIEYDPASGEVEVGLLPRGYKSPGPEGSSEEEQAEESYMKPAKNLNEALQIAKDLLTSDQANEAENNEAFEGGFNKSRGGEY